MDCGIKMWIKCKQKPVKVPANWCEKTNRMWAWVCSWYPNEHVYAKKILCICTHPMQRIDVCYDSQRLVREREIPIPWPPQKPEQTTKIPQKSMWRARCRAFGSARGREGGTYEQICLNQPQRMPSPDSTCELMTSTQHENAVKIDAETWMFQGARSGNLSPGPNLRRRSLYRRGWGVGAASGSARRRRGGCERCSWTHGERKEP